MQSYITKSPTMDLIIATILIAMTVFYYYITATFNHWKSKNVFHLKPVPFFGHFLPVMSFKKSPGEVFLDHYNSTKDPFMGLYVFRRPYLLVRDPNLIKAVLIKDFQYFCNRSHADARDIDPLGTTSLLSIPNPDWRTIRIKLSPIFSSAKLKHMYPLLLESGTRLNKNIDELQERRFEVKETCLRYTADTITSVAFGIDANSLQKSSLAEIHRVAINMFKFTWKRGLEFTSYFFVPAFVKLFGFKFFGEEGSKFLRKIFWETVNYREQNNVQRNDLIDMLIKLKNSGSIDAAEQAQTDLPNSFKFEGDALAAQAAAFFAAGNETSSSTMTFALYHLASSPKIQERLRNEIHNVLSQTNGELTYESLSKLKYMEQVIKESLRLYPILPFLDRQCVRDYIIPGTKIKIEKGTPVLVSLFGLHRNSEYWSNPSQFDPERFNEENIRNIVPYTYMPFGEGPRNCMGERYAMLQLKVGIVNVIKDFRVELNKPEDFSNEKAVDLDPKGLLLTPANPIHLKFAECHP